MAKRRNDQHLQQFKQKQQQRQAPMPLINTKFVNSLLDAMIDGKEFGSIVGLLPSPGKDLIDELGQAVLEIEQIRKRPCIVYIGDVSKGVIGSGIEPSDDLPFHEMVATIDPRHKSVDIILATIGGLGQQVSRFVSCLRPRFDEVEFLLPSYCMSAGTIFALSGDRIWMTPRACLGPIDPQVPSKDGRFIPAQALLLLVDQLHKDGQDAISRGKSIPWTAVQIINSMDKKELAEAITASKYSINMATQFLETYKFKLWNNHRQTNAPVDANEKHETAVKIASALASHDRWKNHGHAITRDVLRDEIELLIDSPDHQLERALRRFWAMASWIFDKTPVIKILISKDYRYLRNRHVPTPPNKKGETK